ncbi:hypothetical protein Avbf_07217, partial [Armadillidium vulgare]
IAGHVILNYEDFHFYTATKYALNAVSEGLRQEMRELKSHIRISINDIIIRPTEESF